MRRYAIVPVSIGGPWDETVGPAAKLVRGKTYASMDGAAAAWHRACRATRPVGGMLIMWPCQFVVVEEDDQ